MVTILLLTASNIFMTFAWYGHLKFSEVPLWKVIIETSEKFVEQAFLLVQTVKIESKMDKQECLSYCEKDFSDVSNY